MGYLQQDEGREEEKKGRVPEALTACPAVSCQEAESMLPPAWSCQSATGQKISLYQTQGVVHPVQPLWLADQTLLHYKNNISLSPNSHDFLFLKSLMCYINSQVQRSWKLKLVWSMVSRTEKHFLFLQAIETLTNKPSYHVIDFYAFLSFTFIFPRKINSRKGKDICFWILTVKQVTKDKLLQKGKEETSRPWERSFLLNLPCSVFGIEDSHIQSNIGASVVSGVHCWASVTQYSWW